MSKLKGPKCPVCVKLIDNSNIPENQPVRIYENCKRCALEKKVFIATPILVFIFYLVYSFSTGRFDINELGFVMGIVGSLLLVNNLAKPLLAGTVWDGFETVAKELPRIRYTNIVGFLLLTASFAIFFASSIATQPLQLQNSGALQFKSYWEEFLLGAATSLVAAIIYDRFRKPRIDKKSVNFIQDSDFSLGNLVKLTFKLKGGRGPGFTALIIRTESKQVYANWDENPNPLKNDEANSFAPELVPATYYLPLTVGVEYSVPILIQPNESDEWNLFSGWWFDETGAYDKREPLNPDQIIELRLVGYSEIWSGKYNIHELTL